MQEVDRLEVLAPAVLVRHPVPRLARVIEVEHRRDGVDAQAVDVVLVRARTARSTMQEIAHLVAAVVEDERAPVLVLALARVGVLVAARVPSKRARPCASFGKCAGTQSSITPMPRLMADSRPGSLKSSGGPNRLVGAKNPVT